MTLTVNFISNQQGIVAGNSTDVRFWDKSVTTNGIVTSWFWTFGDSYSWIPDGTTNPTWIDISGASTTLFQVDDRVTFSSPGSLPGSLSATVAYWVKTVASAGGYTIITVSTTQGGSAVTANGGGYGSGYTIHHGSDQQNPITSYRNVVAGNYNVSLTCNDSGNTGATTTTKTGYINAIAYTFSKPVNAGIYGRITIFVYDSTNATVINRLKSANNHLFFQSLKCTGYIDKSDTATFTVYTTGDATATEIGMMVADKNVTIISGRDVIWSGKISRAIQTKMSLYDTANPFMSWAVECDSDIAKMRYQNVKAANQIAYNAPPGVIINKLVEPAVAGDIDWRGVVIPSLISYEGANIQYTITSADMQSQFLTLADLTGFDWRTRNDWIKYAYGASGYDPIAKTVTVSAIAPYTTNSFAGKWLLFVNANDSDIVTLAFTNGGLNNGGHTVTIGETLAQQSATVHGTVLNVTLTSGSWTLGTAAGTITLQETDGAWISGQYFDASIAGANSAYITTVTPVSQTNTIGIKAYGNVASNTTTVITLTSITNPMNPPVSTDDVIILGSPVLDFSSDLRQPTYVSTFTMNKARDATLQNGYEMNDMSDFKQIITKAIAKGKAAFVDPRTSISTTIAGTLVATLYAFDAWDPVHNFFDYSTYITQLTEGYIYSYTANATSLILIGQGYALKSGDQVFCQGIRADGSVYTATVALSGSPTTQIQSDGTPTTTIPLTGLIEGYNWPKYGQFYGYKTYYKPTGVVMNLYGGAFYVGSDYRSYSPGGTDAVYGPYMTLDPVGAGSVLNNPHLPGCIMQQQYYAPPPSTVEPNSPIDLFGIISKTFTADQGVTPGQLEIYVTNQLINNSFYYRKGTFWAFVYDWFKPDIRQVNEVSENGWLKAGDEICVLQHTGDSATDLQYGQYKNQWQVVGWTLDADQMTISAELGDHERNTNTLINDKTSGINYTIT